MRYVSFSEIAAAVDGMPIALSENELIRVSRQTASPLKYIRHSGRHSPALWRVDHLCAWFARRYKHAPDLVTEFALRLNAPVRAKTKARVS